MPLHASPISPSAALHPVNQPPASRIRPVPWHLDFAQRSGQHRHVEVARPQHLSAVERHALARSLATFQVGESGDGHHLLAAAEASGTTQRYRDALSMFVTEEQEHARLLQLVIYQLDAPLRLDHWSERIFVALRRMKSLRTEVLTLLVAELIALSYYSALADGIPELTSVFDRIHDDEVRHVDFHADTLPRLLLPWSPPVRQAVRVYWNVLVTGASVVVALDHRAALRIAGISPWTFVLRVWRDRQHLDHRLFDNR